MDNNFFTDGIKKIFLAGVGAAAVTSEKASEILDDLVKKGELTVEQGKQLNQELKHNFEEKAKSFTAKKEEAPTKEAPVGDIVEDAAEETSEKVEEAADSLKEAAEALKEDAAEMAETAAQTITEIGKKLKDLTADEIGDLKKALADLEEKLRDK